MDERVPLSLYLPAQANSLADSRTKPRVTFSLTSGQLTSSNGHNINVLPNSSTITARTAVGTKSLAEIEEEELRSDPELHINLPNRNSTGKESLPKEEKASKMFCSYRCCILLLIVQIFLLGVILPVHLQEMDYHAPPVDYDNSQDPRLHGFPNPDEYQHYNGDGDNRVALSEGLTSAQNTQPSDPDERPPVPQEDDAIKVVQHIGEPSGHAPNDVHEESDSSAAHSSSGDGDSGSAPPSSSSSSTTESTPEESTTSESGSESDISLPPSDNASETEAPVVSEPTSPPSLSSSSTTESETGSVSSSNSNCPQPPTVPVEKLMDKLEGLMEKVKGIDESIHKMESLMQSTVVDERIYKCIAAITTGNQSLALKYWNQILRYQSSPTMKVTVLKQLIKESYSGKESNLSPVVKFIQSTEQFYGYSILLKELTNYDQLYSDKGGIFTLAYYIKQSCGQNSDLFHKLPTAVRSVLADFFTLQNKSNKGYLYYAKRCVARHYYYCLDVLTKWIEKEEMDALESEERRRYHWKLNATDDTASKFFILNQDKYWSYRLQDLNNSPRFKMEEAGNTFEREWAHFELKLHSDNEIAVQVRDTNSFLEGEEFVNGTEALLHSYYKTGGGTATVGSNANRIYWLVSKVDPVDGARKVNGNGKDPIEHENCKVEVGDNGNGNGGESP